MCSWKYSSKISFIWSFIWDCLVSPSLQREIKIPLACLFNLFVTFELVRQRESEPQKIKQCSNISTGEANYHVREGGEKKFPIFSGALIANLALNLMVIAFIVPDKLWLSPLRLSVLVHLNVIVCVFMLLFAGVVCLMCGCVTCFHTFISLGLLVSIGDPKNESLRWSFGNAVQ